MGKPPRSRHSRTHKDPVTIDLDASEVERIRDDQPPATEEAAPGAADTGPGVADQTADIAPREQSLEEKRDAGAGPGDESVSAEHEGAADTGTPPDAPAAASDTTAHEPVQEPWQREAADESPSDPAMPPPAASGAAARSGGRAGAFVAGAAGGLIVVALAAGLQWAGLLPSPVPTTDPATAELHSEVEELRQALAAQPAGAAPEELARLQEALAAAEAEIGAVSARLDEQPAADLEPRIEALEAAIAGAGEAAPAEGLLAGIKERVADIEAAIAGLGDQAGADAAPQEAVAALENRLAELEAAIATLGREAAPGEELEAVESRIAALEQAIEGAGEAAGRVEALEAALRSLQQELQGVATAQQEQADGPRAALVIAASALRAAIERGDAFTVELDTFAALSPQTEGLDELRAVAGTGVATREQILAELPAAADRMVAAARPREEAAGFWDSLWQSAQDLVSVRPIGSVEGDSVEAIVARLEVAIRSGDYEAALAEYGALPEGARAAGRDFMERVELRHRADIVTERALADALRPA